MHAQGSEAFNPDFLYKPCTDLSQLHILYNTAPIHCTNALYTSPPSLQDLQPWHLILRTYTIWIWNSNYPPHLPHVNVEESGLQDSFIATKPYSFSVFKTIRLHRKSQKEGVGGGGGYIIHHNLQVHDIPPPSLCRFLICMWFTPLALSQTLQQIQYQVNPIWL